MTAGGILAEMANTQYIISETAQYNNGGFGTAERGVNGAPNTDTLYFEPFDGDREWKGINYNDYADVNYIRAEGMVGIMLHEIGHMTL